MTETPRYDPTADDYVRATAEEPKYTESDMRVLTEAALRLGRREALDELATPLLEASDALHEAARIQIAWDSPTALRIARAEAAMNQALEIASQPSPDATSGRTDPGGTPSHPQDSQAVHKPFPDDGVTYCGWHVGDGVIHEGCGEVWPCSTIRNTVS